MRYIKKLAGGLGELISEAFLFLSCNFHILNKLENSESSIPSNWSSFLGWEAMLQLWLL
jgi:hypothetical protein